MNNDTKAWVLFIIAIVLFIIPWEGLGKWIWDKATKSGKK